MSEKQATTVYAPITITVDVDDLMKRHQVDLAQTVAAMTAEKLVPDLRKEVAALVRDAALTRVDTLVAEVFEGPINLTNGYGERTGQTTTLREQVVAAVKERLNAKVTRNGSHAASYDRDAIPLIKYTVQEMAKSVLGNELKAAAQQAVEEVKAGIRTAVSDELGAKIAQALTRATL